MFSHGDQFIKNCNSNSRSSFLCRCGWVLSMCVIVFNLHINKINALLFIDVHTHTHMYVFGFVCFWVLLSNLLQLPGHFPYYGHPDYYRRYCLLQSIKGNYPIIMSEKAGTFSKINLATCQEGLWATVLFVGNILEHRGHWQLHTLWVARS